MTRAARKPTIPDYTAKAGTRERALIAALALFDAQGVESTTIEQVRDAAEVSIGSLYHHFGSREGLVTALYEDLLERYRVALMAELSRHDTPRAFLDAFVKTHIAWSIRHPDAARFLAEHRYHRAVTVAEAKLQRGTADFLRPLMLLFRPAVETGILKPIAPDVLISLIVGPVQAWLRSHRAGKASIRPDLAAKQLADTIWDAIAAPTPARKTRKS
ncbi:MAG: TetR/AcrR family transcriptional regulator [Ferrovibrio sp.]|uniref:TetR/AcrR family transcriptional regulator n=1 Tax=Ferrovibrio sp. TaxID=1917215 RepID=UPI00391CD7D1